MTTETPLDACPHCGSSFSHAIGKHSCHFDLETNGRTKLCLTAEALIRASRQNTELKTEIEQLNIAGATAVAAAKLFKQRAEKAEAENVCLQELIQEFYEWTRRDFPTEQEVREIMDRYHNLLNK